MYLIRKIEEDVRRSLRNNPVVALIGPRQCGKSTLVKQMLQEMPDSIYLDLERPSDLLKLENAEWFLSTQKGKLICIDEVQRKPELFPLIRSLVDEWNQPGAFLILGSASRELLLQSSESLAGRISYKRLTPFLLSEIQGRFSSEIYLTRGAFPRSLLATDERASYEWRSDFIATYLERDLLFWRNVTPATMRKLWQMLAHLNGQTVEYATLGRALGISSVVVKNYIDLLESTFMVEVLLPYHSNLGKRLVKAPKVYVADSGIAANLLSLRSFEDISGHPAIGAVWEQIVLTNLKGTFVDASFFYYRTSHGAEVDLVMQWENNVFVIECKTNPQPTLSRGNYNAIEDIRPFHSFVVIPTQSSWSFKEGVDVVSLDALITRLKALVLG